MENGLTQIVKSPTQEQYLLDLVLTDLGDSASTKVLPAIADHCCVLARFNFSLDTHYNPPRTVWNFRSADWNGVSEFLSTVDYSFINIEDVDRSTERLNDIILSAASTYISTRTIDDESSTHPWLTARCREAIADKHSTLDKDLYRVKCVSCSTILKEEFNKYVANVKRRLSDLPRGSRLFWKESKKLLLGTLNKAKVPILKTPTSWARQPQEKANLFAQTFREKWNLPQLVTNFYSFEASSPSLLRHGLLQLRTRDGRYYLSSLDVTSATGPDGLSTFLLRQLSHILCFPFTMLARRIVHTGKWPLVWKKHWICPLFKRNSRFLASNYRGLQITSQMSKAMERFLGVHFLTHLSVSGAFGTSQFAYRKYHGARDAVLYVTLVWLLAFAHGRKVGIYCSDVSSAFDRVDSEILLAKLRI